MSPDGDITRLLHAWGNGDAGAVDQLFARVFEELQRLAHRQLRGEATGHTLDTGSLVNEAYLRLVELDPARWQNRGHFFAMAARAMRQVLVQYAIQRKAVKRGGGRTPVSIENVAALVEARSDELLALDQALERLERAEPRYVRVVECRLFAGLTIEETAAALEISVATVKRDLTLARAWLNRELSA
jgi:RNA polymerase sigma factor (TIGR02999 family)